MTEQVVDTRHIARLLAVQYLFTRAFPDNSHENIPFEPNALTHILEVDKFDRKLYEFLVTGNDTNITKLDEFIKVNAPDRPIEQIYLVNLIILRLAIYEAFIAKSTPPKVVINEYIEISKELNQDSSFINGVLGTIYKTQQGIK